MKKALFKVMAVTAAAIMFVCCCGFALAGCGEQTQTADVTGTVYSNGGSIVQYGGYVYFINGIPDYTDESGTSNVEGRVVKGGIYRAKIRTDRPASVDEEENKLISEGVLTAEEYAKTENRSTTLFDVLDFEYEIKDYIRLKEYTIGNESGTEQATYTDANGKIRQNYVPTNGGASEFSVKVEQVVGKKAGTTGYDGGLWIYDGVIYFASPSTERDTEGNVEYNRASFWAFDINRGSLSLLYTATEVNNAMPYAFYKIGDSVYLTTYENYYANADDEEKGITTGYIVVNRISGTSVKSTYELVEGVTSAYFPVSETYDPNDKSPSDAEDFVYFTRDNTSDDANPKGVTLEMISPAANGGEENARFTVDTASTGSIAVQGLEGGYLYYTKTRGGKTALLINSLYTQLHAHDEAYNETNCVAPPMTETEFVLCDDTSAYTTILPIPQDSNDMLAPCFMGANSNGIYRVTATGRTQVYNGTITLVGYHDGRIYCTLDAPEDEETETDDTTQTEDTEEDETMTALISASAYQSFTYSTAVIHNIGIPPTTTPFSFDFFSLTFDINGTETTETYLSYFGTYGGSMTNYMYISKVSGSFIRSASNVKLGDTVYSEEPAIVCYDHNCINLLHDHSSWDDYTPDEEEEGTTEGADSTLTM